MAPRTRKTPLKSTVRSNEQLRKLAIRAATGRPLYALTDSYPFYVMALVVFNPDVVSRQSNAALHVAKEA